MPELMGPAISIPRIEAIPDIVFYPCASCCLPKQPDFLYYRNDIYSGGKGGYFCAPCIVMVAKKTDWKHTDVNLREVVDAGRAY